jgi:protein tyrosine phosphatase (PTP) superfamily phosphohydrolase (DUF442 family)
MILGCLVTLWGLERLEVTAICLGANESDAHAGPNMLVHVAEGIYSGAEPKGAREFDAIAKLGVKVLLSVDGIRPDLKTASKFGLRYVHAPMSYGGMSDHVRGVLERLVAEGRGPIYVHCHHGKHRGPAAAAMLAMIAEQTDREGALSVMRQAGTSPRYAGLWRMVRRFKPWAPGERELPHLVEAVESQTTASVMAGIDRVFDDLEERAEAGWSGESQPKVAEQAVLLGDGFRENARTLRSAHTGNSVEVSDQLRLLQEATDLAYALEQDATAGDWASAQKKYESLAAACVACHRKHRD